MKRWPIIRHVRWFYFRIQVNRHYWRWGELGYLPINSASDEAQLLRIWRGEA